jgi:hypothetical protein
VKASSSNIILPNHSLVEFTPRKLMSPHIDSSSDKGWKKLAKAPTARLEAELPPPNSTQPHNFFLFPYLSTPTVKVFSIEDA